MGKLSLTAVFIAGFVKDFFRNMPATQTNGITVFFAYYGRNSVEQSRVYHRPYLLYGYLIRSMKSHIRAVKRIYNRKRAE